MMHSIITQYNDAFAQYMYIAWAHQQWDTFHDTFPFPQLAQATLQGDVETASLLGRLYKACRQFLFGECSISEALLGQIHCEVQFPGYAIRNADANSSSSNLSNDDTSSLPNLIRRTALDHNSTTDKDSNANDTIPVVIQVNLPALFHNIEIVNQHDSDSSNTTARSIHAMTSGPRTTGRATKRIKVDQAQQIKNTPALAKCEIDTRADTCCRGINCNCRPLSYTGQVCEVSGFHKQFESISSGVPVGSFATAYTNQDTGDTVILIIHEALGFGDSLDHTLINPNQIRAHDNPVWDNPFDPSHSMGIEADDFVFPFQSRGSTIYFETHYPTDAEMETCPHVILTSQLEWDPDNVSMLGSNASEVESTRVRKIV